MVKNLNVTIGSGITRLISAGSSIRCNWVTFYNRDAHDMAVGGPDVTVGSHGLGIPLPVSGSNYQNRSYIGQTNLGYWYVAGTQNDILSITYDDGVDNLS